MKVIITTPYPVDALNGNTVSAFRIAGILHQVGVDASVIQVGYDVGTADVMIALHAKKSAPAMVEFLKLNPASRLVLFLTGTDLYEDIPNGCQICHKSMELAHAIVVSQDASLASVPDEFIAKAAVVFKSIDLPEDATEHSDELISETDPLFTVVSHLREVKQPFLAVRALKSIDLSCQLRLLGGELDQGYAEIARELEAEEPRFKWLGERAHGEALGWMRHSAATINTSLSEGGANSIGESIMLGVPVLASKVEGNVGMLGADYAGYFESQNVQDLSRLMRKFLTDKPFRERLAEQVSKRSELFQRSRERDGWLAIISNKNNSTK